jgi:antirestriction protein
MQTTIDQYADILDVRNIIARVEELESELQDAMDANEEGHNLETLAEYVGAIRQDCGPAHAHRLINEAEELTALRAFLEELAGFDGGDEKWRGDWYPVTLIRESYFVDYVQELLEDCGDIPKNLPHYIHIDWERTARDVRVDYSCADFHGVTYWFR